jgi:ribosome-associated protein
MMSARLVRRLFSSGGGSSHWRVPDDDVLASHIEFQYARSSGPGGQNVNKVNTKCQAFVAIHWLPDDVRARLLQLVKQTQSGRVLIQSDAHRTQQANRNETFAKLRALLATAAVPETERVATVVPERVHVQRVDAKRRRSDVKASRSRVDWGGD